MTWLLLALSLASAPLQAALLAEFSCVRPKAVDAGTWHNVSLAASLVDGAVVPAGTQFSYLQALQAGKGRFEPGNTLYGGRVIKSIGGGYCQVSTAIYNAVLLAGLPIVERYAHSFYDAEDAYVEPGRDAAVSGSEHADFRFENSLPAALTLSVKASEGRVSVAVFGAATPKKRRLVLSSTRIPMRRWHQRSEAPEGTVLKPGFDGYIVRRSLVVEDAQGNTKSRELSPDRYEMIREIVARP